MHQSFLSEYFRPREVIVNRTGRSATLVEDAHQAARDRQLMAAVYGKILTHQCLGLRNAVLPRQCMPDRLHDFVVMVLRAMP
jgi:hypothetical protein